MTTTITAVVQSIQNGRHGRYAVATSEEFKKGSITFLLQAPVWNERDEPEGGTSVILTDLRKKRAGWRATSARYMRLDDQQ